MHPTFIGMNHMQSQRLYIVLIVTSMLLLLLFTGSWLYKSYEEQEDMLRRETGQLFGVTMRDLQDSLLRENIFGQLEETFKVDFPRTPSAARPNSFNTHDRTTTPDPSPKGSREDINQVQTDTSANMDTSIINELDRSGEATSLTRFRYEKDIPRLLVNQMDSMTIKKDSGGVQELQLFLRARENRRRHAGVNNLPSGMNDKVKIVLGSPQGENPFAVHLEGDQQHLDFIRKHYSSKLDEANIPLDFTLLPREEALKLSDEGEGIMVVSYRRRNGERVSPYKLMAFFPKTSTYLIRQMVPQMLFSLILLVLTGSAFTLLYRSWRKQQRLALLKNDFISNMTHELKTPITTVGVALEAMSNFNALRNPEKTDEYLNISRNELNRLSMLVDKVLKMSIFESRDPMINPETIDLQQLANQIVQSMDLHFQNKGAKLDMDFTGSDFSVTGDRVHLTNVLYNLLDNAIKYSDGQARVSLQMEGQSDQVIIRVSDQGIGIPSQYQSKVFDKFFRVPTGDQHNRKGHGLGLSYVAQVIEKHNGTISLDSQLNQGTTFTIQLKREHA